MVRAAFMLVFLLTACGATVDPTKFNFQAEKSTDWDKFDKSANELNAELDRQVDDYLCSQPKPKGDLVIWYERVNGKCVMRIGQ